MNILITGGTGFIGKELIKYLDGLGHKLTVVTREVEAAQKSIPQKVKFLERDLNKAPMDLADFKNIDAFINLAGENINGRWTSAKKQKIKNSRVITSRNLVTNCPLEVLAITASAIGYYGDRGDEVLNEYSTKGVGFLSEVTSAWESEFNKLKNHRVVIFRLGIVLSKKGGVLQQLKSIFSKHVGSVLGNGKQWVSYISLNDLCRIIGESLVNSEYSGTINAVNNEPITNEELGHALAGELNVILLPRVPKVALKIILGEMSELVLSSQRVISDKLKNFVFEDKKISELLKKELS